MCAREWAPSLIKSISKFNSILLLLILGLHMWMLTLAGTSISFVVLFHTWDKRKSVWNIEKEIKKKTRWMCESLEPRTARSINPDSLEWTVIALAHAFLRLLNSKLRKWKEEDEHTINRSKSVSLQWKKTMNWWIFCCFSTLFWHERYAERLSKKLNYNLS